MRTWRRKILLNAGKEHPGTTSSTMGACQVGKKAAWGEMGYKEQVRKPKSLQVDENFRVTENMTEIFKKYIPNV